MPDVPRQRVGDAGSAASAAHDDEGVRGLPSGQPCHHGVQEVPRPGGAMSVVDYRLDGAAARITLNRPGERNALNAEILAELRAALERSAVGGARTRGAADRRRQRFLFRGRPERAREGIPCRPAGEHGGRTRSGHLFLQMRRHPRPIVAAVRGRALAGGAAWPPPPISCWLRNRRSLAIPR